jgi:hypothetical protein
MMTGPTAETSAGDMSKVDMSVVRGGAMRKALQPFNGLRVLAAVHIMVRKDLCDSSNVFFL